MRRGTGTSSSVLALGASWIQYAVAAALGGICEGSRCSPQPPVARALDWCQRPRRSERDNGPPAGSLTTEPPCRRSRSCSAGIRCTSPPKCPDALAQRGGGRPLGVSTRGCARPGRLRLVRRLGSGGRIWPILRRHGGAEGEQDECGRVGLGCSAVHAVSPGSTCSVVAGGRSTRRTLAPTDTGPVAAPASLHRESNFGQGARLRATVPHETDRRRVFVARHLARIDPLDDGVLRRSHGLCLLS